MSDREFSQNNASSAAHGDNGDEAGNFQTWPPAKSKPKPQAAAAAAANGGAAAASPAVARDAVDGAGHVKFAAADAVVVPVGAPVNNPKTPLLTYADLRYHQSSDDDGSGAAALNFLTPRDEYNAAYMTFVLLGVGLLFPWNTVISAADYFNVLFPGESIEFLFTISYMSSNFIGLMFVLRYGTQYSFQSRIVPGFVVYAICMLCLPFIENKGASLLVVCILGLCDSVVQGSLFGLVGLFSPRYVSGFMTGQGFAGLLVALLRLFAKGVFPNDSQGIRHSGYLYFTLSVAVIIAAVLCYLFVLQKSPVTKHYLSKPTREVGSAFSRFVTVPLSQHDARRDAAGLAALTAKPAVNDSAANEPSAGELWTQVKAIWSQVWVMALTVFSIFLVTLALFPGITSEMTSTNARLNDGQWFGIIMITLFDLGDVIGRSIPNWPSTIIRNETVIGLLGLLRVVFLPLFIACARHDAFFTNDAYPVIIMLCFAVSNGYLGTITMMRAVDKVASKDKELTGTFMVFFLTIGLTSGVWLGYILNVVLGL